MASTVYFGKSTTSGATETKNVILSGTFDADNLHDGDVLNVYFTQKNEHSSINLALYINDSNNNNAVNSRIAYNTGTIAVQPGAWGPGEVVNFVYVAGNNNQAEWQMVAKGIATSSVYGNVLLDSNDVNNENTSAISIANAKTLIAASNTSSLTYVPEINTGTILGYLTYTTPSQSNTLTLYTPTIPSDLGGFTNNAGYLTNQIDTNLYFTGDVDGGDSNKQLWVVDDDDNTNQCIIDLKDDSTGAFNVTAIDNILLQPANGKDVIIGSQNSNADLVVNGGLTISGNASLTGNTTTITNLVATDAAITNLTATNSDLGATDVDSLSIDGVPLNTYLQSNYNVLSSTNFNKIFQSPNIRWERKTSDRFTLAPGAYNWQIKVGDFSKEGYRTVGIISWECYHDDNYNGTNPWFANLYGFYWERSSVSGENNVLYAKVSNISTSKSIENLRVTAFVWYVKNEPDLTTVEAQEEVQGE